MTPGPELKFVGRTEVDWEGRRLAFFGGNDYHRFATHPEVVEALCAGGREYGVSSSGSRATTANHPLYGRLESVVARFLGVEDAVLCATGYLTNLAVIQGVGDEYDRLLIEDGAHSSLSEAAALAGLPLQRFRSRDPDALKAALRAERGRPVVLCEGVAPSTGHLAPLREYAALAGEWGAGLLVDDAHGIGTLGAHGRGSPEEAGLPPGAVFQTGTLSKAFGCYGGIVAGGAELCAKVRARSTAYVGATPIPLAVAASAIRAILLLEEESERLRLLRHRTLSVKERMSAAGFAVSPGPAPICSLAFPDQAQVAAFRSRLLEARIHPTFIRYPGAPAGGHFRFTLSSEHTDEQVAALVECVDASHT